MRKMKEEKQIPVKCICGSEVFSYPEYMNSIQFSRYVNKLIRNKKINLWRYTKVRGSDDIFLCQSCINEFFDEIEPGESQEEYFYKVFNKLNEDKK